MMDDSPTRLERGQIIHHHSSNLNWYRLAAYLLFTFGWVAEMFSIFALCRAFC